MEVTSDWLDASHDPAREAMRVQALDFAKLYLIFTSGAGKKLLEHWTTTIEAVDTPADSSHASYAYHEGKRSFIRGIKREIERATKF